MPSLLWNLRGPHASVPFGAAAGCLVEEHDQLIEALQREDEPLPTGYHRRRCGWVGLPPRLDLDVLAAIIRANM